jgi:hypothetical protein
MRALSVLLLAILAGCTSNPESSMFGGLPLTGEVKLYQGNPTIHINGKPQISYIYALPDIPGGRWSWEEVPQWNIKQFCDAGVNQFYMTIFLEHMWLEDGTFDITPARKQIQGVQEVCPGSALYLRFHFHMPEWWRDQNLGEMTVFSDVTEYQVGVDYGFKRIIDDDFRAQRRESLASEKWMEDATKMTVRFLDELKRTPESDYLAGIHIAGAVYGEWHYWGFMYNEPDQSEAMHRWFRSWLKETYGTDANLQAAWNIPDATIEDARVPNMQDRIAKEGLFREPVTERWVGDYYRAQHKLVTNRILHFAELVKTNWDRPLIVGTFWGYFFSTFGREASGGHLDYHTVLQSHHIDFVSAPQVYEPDDHLPGHPYRSRGLLQTVRLHGKVWLDEMDQQPVLLSKVFPNYQSELDNSTAVMKRNVLWSLVKGNGLWYFDFGPGGVIFDNPLQRHRGKYGWWDHPVLMKDVARMREVYESKLHEPYQVESDVLFVYDTDVYYHTASRRFSDALSNTAVNWSTLAAYYSGGSFESVHLNDLADMDLSPYKVIVFGNTYHLSTERITELKALVDNNDRHIVWFYAPGYTDGKTLDVNRISQATGINITFGPDAFPFPRVLPDSTIISGAKPYALKTYWGRPDTTLKPMFIPQDPSASIYARFSHDRSPALVKKSFDNHTSWYASFPVTDAATMRQIFKEAGAHLYTETTGDVIYAGNGLVLYHTKRGGEHKITFKNGQTVVLNLPETHATTHLFDARTGSLLLNDNP